MGRGPRLLVAAAIAAALGAAVLLADGRDGSDGRSSGDDEAAACPADERARVVDAIALDPKGYSPDVAARISGLRCRGTFAHGEVCVLCATPPPGATFEVLLQRRDGRWRLVGNGGPAEIDRVAREVGLPDAELAALRR